ncbi:MAG: cadherin-like domain-containing protein, partial [Kiloniellales bacterium]
IAAGGLGTEGDPFAVYVTGTTLSRDFPTNEGAFQTEISEPKKRGKPSTGSSAPDAFIAKIVGPFEGLELVEALEFRLVATTDSYATDEDEALDVMAPGVLENDTDFPSGAVASNTTPGNGTVVLNSDGSFIYTPNADFYGTDSFDYIVSDGESADRTIVIVDVAPFPDPPIANDDMYFAVTNQTLTVSASDGVLANDSDPDGDPFTVSGNSSPDSGTVVLNSDGSFIYSPGSFSGTASFIYQARDGPDVTDVSDPATVTIDVSDGSLHVGDLDESSSVRNKTSWRARVDVRIDDKNHDPLGDANVTFAWENSSGGTGTAGCKTSASSGRCVVTLSVFKNVTSVTFTVTDVTHAALTYKAADNHDPDGDSVIETDGTISVTVFRP